MSILSRIQRIRTEQPSPASQAGNVQSPVRRRRAVSDHAAKPFPSDELTPGDGFVVKCIRMADAEPEESRAGSETVHVSSLVGGDFCPRGHLLAQRHMGGSFNRALSQQRIVWKLGRAAENHVRDQFIRMHGPHRVFGKWTCPCEASEHVGLGDPSMLCPNCGKHVLVYGELDVLDPEAEISGHPDLVFLCRSGAIEVVEIKSKKKDEFAVLLRPEPDHVLQCWGYVKMLRKAHPGIQVNGRILYVAKDYISPKVSPYLEFSLPDAPPVLATLYAAAVETRTHRVAGTLPPRLPACTDLGATRAKRCGACALCFSLND